MKFVCLTKYNNEEEGILSILATNDGDDENNALAVGGREVSRKKGAE